MMTYCVASMPSLEGTIFNAYSLTGPTSHMKWQKQLNLNLSATTPFDTDLWKPISAPE